MPLHWREGIGEGDVLISIVILKLERAGFLKECLPSVLRAVGIYGGDCEVLLIDNGSSDGSAEYVRGNFPW